MLAVKNRADEMGMALTIREIRDTRTVQRCARHCTFQQKTRGRK